MHAGTKRTPSSTGLAGEAELRAPVHDIVAYYEAELFERVGGRALLASERA
jgi:hypothetical protein